MKKYIAISLIFMYGALDAQLNRTALNSAITSTIYANGRNAITGATLQPTVLDISNSCVNLLSDSNLLDVRIFSPYATYTPGMGAFYGDTLWMNVAQAHGTWNSELWLKIAYPQGCVCSQLVHYTDTVHVIATHNFVDVSVSNAIANVIPWADTNSKIITNHALEVALTPYLLWGDTLTKIATNYSALQQIRTISITGAVTGSMGTTGSPVANVTLANNVVGISNLTATGTPSSGTFLRGDNTWGTPKSYVKDSAWLLGGNTIASSNVFGSLNAVPIHGILGDSTFLWADITNLNVTLGYEAMHLIPHSGTIIGNTVIGQGAGYDCYGNYNTYLGDVAGGNNAGGAGNIMIGAGAGVQCDGCNNVIAIGSMQNSPNLYTSNVIAIGPYAGYNLNVAYPKVQYNICMGDSAGFSCTTGVKQIAIGDQAGALGANGNSNLSIAIGDTAHYLGTQWANWGGGSILHNAFWNSFNFMTVPTFYVKGVYSGEIDNVLYNTGYGYNVLNSGNITGGNNTVYGYQTGKSLTSGYSNLFMGSNAGGTTSTSNSIVALGYNAMGNIAGGSSSTAVGAGSMYQEVGTQNTALGYNSMYGYGTGTGSNNVAAGYNSMYYCVSSKCNVAYGVYTLYNGTAANYNSFLGYYAGVGVNTGSFLFGGGDSALYSVTTATHVIGLGHAAGGGFNVPNSFWIDKTVAATLTGGFLYVTSAGQVRDTGNVSSHTIFTPTTGGTVTLVDNQINIINPGATLSSLVVAFPTSPANNDIIRIKYTQTITSLTYTGTVVGAPTTVTQGTFIEYTYDLSTTSWY